jgi:hypothetical protein
MKDVMRTNAIERVLVERLAIPPITLITENRTPVLLKNAVF